MFTVKAAGPYIKSMGGGEGCEPVWPSGKALGW